jgi:branched-chain amino acid transport system permease protein
VRGPGPAAAALAALALAAGLAGGGYLQGQLLLVGAYATALLGLQFLVGTAGLASLGQAAFLAVGAYAAAIALQAGLAWPLALALAGVAGGAAGLAVGVLLRRLDGGPFALATLALAFVAQQIAAMAATVTGGHDGLWLTGPGVDAPSRATLFAAAWVLFLLLFLAVRNLQAGRLGRALRALHQEPLAAASLGLDPMPPRGLAMALAGFAGGVGGALYAFALGFVSPEMFGPGASIALLVMIVVGGAARPLGALWGAVFFILLREGIALAKSVDPRLAADAAGLEAAAMALAVIAVLWLFPGGLARPRRTFRSKGPPQ